MTIKRGMRFVTKHCLANTAYYGRYYIKYMRQILQVNKVGRYQVQRLCLLEIRMFYIQLLIINDEL